MVRDDCVLSFTSLALVPSLHPSFLSLAVGGGEPGNEAISSLSFLPAERTLGWY